MFKFLFNLQLFADEGGADTGGTVDAGATASSDSSIGSAESSDSGQSTQDAQESFDNLIGKGGRYEKDYNARVQKAIQKRFKDNKQLESRVNSMSPVFELYGQKYGIDPKNEKDIIDRLVNENSLYEDEAIRRGMDVDTLKNVKATERENAELRAFRESTMANMENQRKFDRVNQEAEQLKQVYPGFDLDAEMQNPEFERLAWSAGVPLRTAYEVIHKDEILATGMQYAVSQTAEKVTKSIRSGQNRPTEGATRSQAASLTGRSSPSNWTREERAEIKRRVRSGERVSF